MGAAASLTLAVLYFSIWVTNRARAYLLFAVTAASLAVFAFFELQVMFAQTPQQLDAALRWAQVPLSLGLLALIGFVSTYLGAGRRWLVWTICGPTHSLRVAEPADRAAIPTCVRSRVCNRCSFSARSVTLTRGIPSTLGADRLAHVGPDSRLCRGCQHHRVAAG